MLLTTNIRLSRILKFTWKTDLLLIFLCFAAFFFNKYILRQYFELPAIIPTVIGTALAFFIGFNNNQAYARWWEARIIWGSLVNNSRSWARGILCYCDCESNYNYRDCSFQKRMILRHIAFLYALKAALRNDKEDEYKKYLPEEDVNEIEFHSNKHNAILQLQSRDLRGIHQDEKIDGFTFFHLNELIVSFCDDMGRSERIKNTVFPTTYHYFTRLFIWVFSVVITMVAAETTGVWSVLIGWIVGFVFHTTHIIGMSLLNPFELLPSGISLDQITRTIEINLLQMLREENLPETIKPVNNEYIM